MPKDKIYWDNFKYSPAYESSLLRGIDISRPWNIVEEIKKYTKKNYTLLDIGCGTAFKTIKLSPFAKKIYGLEPNPAMLVKAKKNIELSGVKNFILVDGKVEKIPFSNNTFDVVICIVAPYSASEMYRVLKPGGILIMERIGEKNIWDLQILFGKDKYGWRGYASYLKKIKITNRVKNEFSRFFKKIIIRKGSWTTYYNTEGLMLLFEQTPLIRNFDRKKDALIIKKIRKKYLTKRGIKTRQSRILVYAEK